MGLISTSLKSLKNKYEYEYDAILKSQLVCRVFRFPTSNYSFRCELYSGCTVHLDVFGLSFGLMFACYAFVIMNYFQPHRLDMLCLYSRYVCTVFRLLQTTSMILTFMLQTIFSMKSLGFPESSKLGGWGLLCDLIVPTA